MARYSTGRENIIGMKTAQAHVRNLMDDVEVVRGGTATKASRGLNSILLQGKEEMQTKYLIARSEGVENTNEVRFKHNVMDGWGRVEASGPKLFFAEFGTGVNLNSGTSFGESLGLTPASWSVGESGKKYLTGGRFVVFQGWWPVKKSVTRAERREFTSPSGKRFIRRVKQGYPPVNGTEAAFKLMHEIAARTMKHFFELK